MVTTKQATVGDTTATAVRHHDGTWQVSIDGKWCATLHYSPRAQEWGTGVRASDATLAWISARSVNSALSRIAHRRNTGQPATASAIATFHLAHEMAERSDGDDDSPATVDTMLNDAIAATVHTPGQRVRAPGGVWVVIVASADSATIVRHDDDTTVATCNRTRNGWCASHHGITGATLCEVATTISARLSRYPDSAPSAGTIRTFTTTKG